MVDDHLKQLASSPTAVRMRTALAAAVPLWILELQNMPFEHITERAKVCSQIIAEKGDILQFGGEKTGDTAEVFNRFAEGVACLAFVPGGVTFLGDHWEAKHLGERGSER
jgi:hypothetical protein